MRVLIIALFILMLGASNSSHAPIYVSAPDVVTVLATTIKDKNGNTIAGSGAGATWGSITGTLSSQSDLNTALAAKAPTASPTFTGTFTSPGIVYAPSGRIQSIDSKFGWNYIEDFFGYFSSSIFYGNSTWGINVSGTGASCQQISGAAGGLGRSGVAQCDTGTNTGRAGIAWPFISPSFMKQVIIGSGALRFDMRIYLDNLSDDTDTYELQCGFGDTTTGDSTDAILFKYLHSTSANWQCGTEKAGTGTYNTSTLALTAAAWHHLRIDVNAAGTNVDWYVDGTEICLTHDQSNIPTANLSVLCGLRQTVGTNQRNIEFDAFQLSSVFTVPLDN